mgnify:CR=1 FL=1
MLRKLMKLSNIMDHLMTITAIRPKKIAVVGSGISGLSCAWLLNKAHDVTLFEKDDRLGGHSNTVSFNLDEQTVHVDTGFIVFNPVNYPNLVNFLNILDVDSCDTDMSFAVSANQGAFEYSGTGIQGLFAQKRNLFSPTFWSMIKDLLDFYKNSDQLLEEVQQHPITLGELIRQKGYSDSFIRNHLLPFGAAIWSTPMDKMLDYPALSFLRFCKNHGLSQLTNRPQWRTIPGGSIGYVSKIAQSLSGKVRLNSRIHKVIRQHDGILIEDHHGSREHFDQIVLACHADQALSLLANPTKQEKRLLSGFPYQRNQAFLHLDQSLMPKRHKVWSSWNYILEGADYQSQQASVTYWMNQLQPLNTDTPVMVSLNPPSPPAQDKLIRSFFYDHPVFGKESLSSQKLLWQLQGKQNTWFCGAYFGYGFHEDGLQSGLAVAEQLGGIPRPWQLKEPNNRIYVSTPVHTPAKPHTEQPEVVEQING